MNFEDIALTLHRTVKPAVAAHLIDCFGSAEAVYRASKEELIERAGLKSEIAHEIAAKRTHSEAEKEWQWMSKYGVRATAATDEDYPAMLRDVVDHPHVLYYKGELGALVGEQARVISMVGTRNATDYGRRVCDRMVKELSEVVPNLVIVSGLAAGIDGFAHRAALVHGVPTFGVLGTALKEEGVVADNRLMAKQMVKQGGGVMTEFHSRYQTTRFSFPIRNRIIAGLSEGVMVVEAPIRSGALHTARLAHGYGREVLAIPGRIDAAGSAGTHNLIRVEMARIAECADDVIRALGWDNRMPKPVAETTVDVSGLSDGARMLLGVMQVGETVAVDELSEQCGVAISDLMEVILELEMEGLVRYGAGNRLIRE